MAQEWQMGQSGYPLHTRNPPGIAINRPWVIGRDDGAVGRRLDGNGLLRKAVEQETSGLGATAVEAEGELVEVVVEVLVLYPALERSHEPSLEQRSDPVDTRHDDMGRIGAAAEDGDLGVAAGVLESAGTRPSARLDPGARLHGVAREGHQAVGGDIADQPQTHPAEAL